MTTHTHRPHRPLRRWLVGLAGGALLVGAVAGPTAASPVRGATLQPLAQVPGGQGWGSTIGPDGALYVTDGSAGAVDRVDPRTGALTVYATGLPPRVLPIGGAVDVAFLGGQAYALVTMVGGDIVGGPHFGDAADGIYRLDGHGRVTLVADLGAWSVAHPPTTSYFITTGVQYAMAAYRGGFLVTDGHHNRVLRVGLDGSVAEFAGFGDVVPTGLEVQGGKVWVAEAGPVPHVPDTGRILAFGPGGEREVARGARLLVDVELGPRHRLYGLSQGQWDGVMEGSPALPDTGRLFVVDGDELRPVTDASGSALVLDRPTSVEFVGDTAFVVGLTGAISVVKGV